MTLEECRRFFADEVRFAANIRSSELVEAFARVHPSVRRLFAYRKRVTLLATGSYDE